LNCISLCEFLVGCTDRISSVAGNLEYDFPVFQDLTNQMNHFRALNEAISNTYPERTESYVIPYKLGIHVHAEM